MNQCLPCGRSFSSFGAFGRHMTRVHKVDGQAFWRRIEQVGDKPVWATRSDRGLWSLIVQERLSL